MSIYFIILSIIFAFLSAASWLRASVVKVSREQEVAWRKAQANKKGVKANLAGMTLDGWDISGTFRVQAKWNSIAAVLAAISILSQATSQLLEIA